MQKTFTLRHLFRFRNAFLNKFKIPMKKPLKKKLIITTAILMANSTFFFGKNVFFDEPKSNDNVENKLTEHQKKLQSLSKLVKVMKLLLFIYLICFYFSMKLVFHLK